MKKAVEVPKHAASFRGRRALIWIPFGLALLFVLTGKWNLQFGRVLAEASSLDWPQIKGISEIGRVVFFLSPIVAGIITDIVGGKRAFLFAMGGIALANALMGGILMGSIRWQWDVPLPLFFVILFAINMHFQSYVILAIVKIYARWFHVRERGGFSTILGLMATLLAFLSFEGITALSASIDGTARSDPGFLENFFRQTLGTGGEPWWLFFLPAILVAGGMGVLFFFLKNRPSDAGQKDFDTGEESLGENLSRGGALLKMFRHPVLLVAGLIAFCGGALSKVTVPYYLFARKVGFKNDFIITDNWGLSLTVAGVIGAILTGWFSDRFFQSRRGPMVTLLLGCCVIATILMALTLGGNPWFVGAAVCFIFMTTAGASAILSVGTTADFAGASHAAMATGVILTFGYLGGGIANILIPLFLPKQTEMATASNWIALPLFLLFPAVIGLLLSLRIWKARPNA